MRTLIIFAIGLVLAGCGGSSDEETVGKEIADDYNEAMDKAREIEDKLQKHKEEIDKAVQKAMEEVDETIEKQRKD